jgi:hypothetical protein
LKSGEKCFHFLGTQNPLIKKKITRQQQIILNAKENYSMQHAFGNEALTTLQIITVKSPPNCHTSLTVLRAVDGSTDYCQTRAVVSSAAFSTAKLVWEMKHHS